MKRENDDHLIRLDEIDLPEEKVAKLDESEQLSTHESSPPPPLPNGPESAAEELTSLGAEINSVELDTVEHPGDIALPPGEDPQLANRAAKEITVDEASPPLPQGASDSYHRKDSSDPRSRRCPYLDTINRSMLDFDFEKLCSISLSNNNVYACLVCGRYFQGRGHRSHAYIHSVEDSHRVFMNLATLKFFCLPDNYEIVDNSLDDIKYVSNPTYTDEMISQLDTNAKFCRALTGSLYYPGIMGLNNIKANDYCNVVFISLAHVKPIRDFFLKETNYNQFKLRPADSAAVLVIRFGELLRKLWNPRNFKPHVSPHEMLQAVVLCSKKRFQITEQGDPMKVMTWLLNTLHRTLKQLKRKDCCVVTKTFRGRMRVYQRRVLSGDVDSLPASDYPEYADTSEEQAFLCLSVDLPAPPLFQDENKQNIIPQVPLFSILSKFDGQTEHEFKTYKENYMRRYELLSLPPYIILYFQRFTRNNFYLEKNNTIVNFPIRNVDFGQLLNVESNGGMKGCSQYNLIANIVHDGRPRPGEGTYRVHIIHKPTGTWYEMQDLHVNVILPQMITLSESYMQIWERCDQ